MEKIDFFNDYRNPIKSTEEVLGDIDLIRNAANLYKLEELNPSQELEIIEGESIFLDFLRHLELGNLRAAERIDGNWQTNPKVKEMILSGFGLGQIVDMSNGYLPFYDKHTYPTQKFPDFKERKIRILGGDARRGSRVGNSVTIMKGGYINAGAFVGDITMIDHAALIGSCAQVGGNCHISAFAGVGGVLEPAQAAPCVVEDGCFMGMHSSIAEGVILKERVVLGGGVNLTNSTPIWDNINKVELRGSATTPLIIPANSIVIMKINKSDEYLYRIVKLRDDGTDAKTALEMALR